MISFTFVLQVFLGTDKSDVFKKPAVPPLKQPKLKLYDALRKVSKCYSNPKKQVKPPSTSIVCEKESRAKTDEVVCNPNCIELESEFPET